MAKHMIWYKRNNCLYFQLRSRALCCTMCNNMQMQLIYPLNKYTNVTEGYYIIFLRPLQDWCEYILAGIRDINKHYSSNNRNNATTFITVIIASEISYFYRDWILNVTPISLAAIAISSVIHYIGYFYIDFTCQVHMFYLTVISTLWQSVC